MSGSRRRTGNVGEEMARQFLQRAGYRILQLNYHCPLGEIDIVARKGPLLVFVEVRTRTGHRFGKAVESITVGKKKRLARIASYYLARELGREVPCRVDLVAIEIIGKHPPCITHLKNIVP